MCVADTLAIGADGVHIARQIVQGNISLKRRRRHVGFPRHLSTKSVLLAERQLREGGRLVVGKIYAVWVGPYRAV